jgi:hypothetical protein
MGMMGDRAEITAFHLFQRLPIPAFARDTGSYRFLAVNAERVATYGWSAPESTHAVGEER